MGAEGENESLHHRVEELERRVADLEDRGGSQPEAGAADAGDFWALSELQRRMPDGGAILFTGDVTLGSGEHWSWQQGVGARSILESDWHAAFPALSALDHPVRLTILQAVMQGTTTVAELTEVEGLGTTGQVYHHLRALVAGGWLATSRRGHYAVPGHRVVPLLVIITAGRD
jgi:Helix-turn-helix domain